MKFNWGTGIALFYLLFMSTMIYFVYQSTQHDRNLVVDNYYEKDLQYQSHLDKLNNAKNLKIDLKVVQNYEEKYIRFSFPTDFSEVEGEILFYRPSDQSKDFTTKIQLNENNELVVPTSEMLAGGWQVKVDWTGDKIPFFKKVNIHI